MGPACATDGAVQAIPHSVLLVLYALRPHVFSATWSEVSSTEHMAVSFVQQGWLVKLLVIAGDDCMLM